MHNKNTKSQYDKKAFLVGSPNVGKSAIFNALTGSYVTVSNYPGTTVDISSGTIKVGAHHTINVIDTPGMYSLRPITAEEEVTRTLIFKERPDCIIHVVDAKNLGRMLPLTMQLIETGFPVVLVLNLYDEMLARGIRLNIGHLEHDLGIPVVETVAVKGIGIENLNSRIVEVVEKRYNFNAITRSHSHDIENKLAEISELLENVYPISKRSIALLALQGDTGIMKMIKDDKHYSEIEVLLSGVSFREMVSRLSQEKQALTQGILSERMVAGDKKKGMDWQEKISNVLIHPIWGLPVLAIVLWVGLYKFVGEFGAGTLVDLIETNLFENIINPFVDNFFGSIFGSNTFFNLFAGEYGIITLGLRYAFAIILPIVTTFFIVFSIIEDTGYLPRLAMLVDRVFKKIGLSGRAIVPLTLGLGCDTMATIVTRTLESNKEKIIATLLLTLAVPCSAQLGVLVGLLGGKPLMLCIWAGTVLAIFLFTGLLCKYVVKGEDASFFMELPPLRWPSFLNIFTKTYTRVVWYFKEILPIFILASVFIWFGKLTGIFTLLVKLMSFPVVWSGMPEAASPAFLYGFFRRDFGAAGLFDLAKEGTLTGNSLLIAAVVLTLFVPCVAQFVVTWKERGRLMAVGMALFIFPFAFFVGFILNLVLNVMGVVL